MSQLFFTVKDAAERYAVSVRTVERWIERGELSAVKFGPKLTRIRPSDLDAFEAKLCPTTASNDPSSTGSNPPDGTSAGRRGDARIVSLQRRQTS